MTKQYTPRRANLRRWLAGAPGYILDCFDDGGPGDRYTVVFGADFMPKRGAYHDSWVSYLCMSGAPTHPQGVSIWGEMPAWYMAAYRRRRSSRKRVAWQSLPENIRAHVIARATSTD
jgi:hypothetical protein